MDFRTGGGAVLLRNQDAVAKAMGRSKKQKTVSTPLHIRAKPFLDSRSGPVSSRRRLVHSGSILGSRRPRVSRMSRRSHGRRGRKTDPAWTARRSLLSVSERLRPDSFARMPLIDTGDDGLQILTAYVVKEELRSLLARSGANPERPVIRARLHSPYQHAAVTDGPEAHRLAGTIDAWWPAIEAAALTACSNPGRRAATPLAKHQGEHSVKP
jgi:hypothetical protein